MAGSSKIHWTNDTWNPVTGCSKVSQGCKNCYAEVLAKKFRERGMPGYENGFAVTLHPERIKQPLRWKAPRRVFVNSMSDLFHEEIPRAFLDDVWEVMAQTERHTYQILTKRPENIPPDLQWLPNVWLGVSTEDQDNYVKRMPYLLQTGAPVRFISAEPLLGPIDLDAALILPDWVIVGGESGNGHRLMELDWARSLRDQCQQAAIPFFYKQGNSFHPGRDRILDGEMWEEYPCQENQTPDACA